MPKITFDTNIFIARKRLVIPKSAYHSIVVLSELVVGANDEAEIKAFDVARREAEKAGRLLVPNGEDWWLVGKVINAMQRGLKAQRGGQTPKLAAEEKYRLTNDVLIARTARRAGVTVVTDNVKDFDAIQSFCRVRLLSGNEYFGF